MRCQDSALWSLIIDTWRHSFNQNSLYVRVRRNLCQPLIILVILSTDKWIGVRINQMKRGICIYGIIKDELTKETVNFIEQKEEVLGVF